MSRPFEKCKDKRLKFYVEALTGSIEVTDTDLAVTIMEIAMHYELVTGKVTRDTAVLTTLVLAEASLRWTMTQNKDGIEKASIINHDIVAFHRQQQVKSFNKILRNIVEQLFPDVKHLDDQDLADYVSENHTFQLATFPHLEDTNQYVYVDGVCVGAIVTGMRENMWVCEFNPDLKR